MENPTPKQVLDQLKRAINEALQALDELLQTINELKDCPEKQESIKNAQILKGDIIQAVIKDMPKFEQEKPNSNEC